jgi:hypothetical protein
MTYNEYRKFHGPLAAWVLSIHPAVWYGSCVLITLTIIGLWS